MIRENLIRELREVVDDRYVLIEKEDVIVYEQDGSILQAMPEIVVLPGNVEQVSAVVKAARRANVPIVPRGSGTDLPEERSLRINQSYCAQPCLHYRIILKNVRRLRCSTKNTFLLTGDSFAL